MARISLEEIIFLSCARARLAQVLLFFFSSAASGCDSAIYDSFPAVADSRGQAARRFIERTAVTFP